ncbi:MAG TPA: tRNA pseudouridine(55) synthase TruB [Candidatus Goldiibacteriota bacterium]|nr:tRNA pseudouridine(55) synthase TruB [Candidatus Goldiibacteriota bacterium]
MDGILLISKEKGPTSFDTIEQLKRKFKLKKIGHAGTLDPMAEGLLIALVGKATKLSDYMPDEKVYEIEVLFGKRTNTDDLEGETVEEKPVPDGLEALIKQAIPSFTGVISQVPPAFSAIKKDGKKLYELARAGVEVKPEPRQVTINSISLISVSGNTAKLSVSCMTGTYMRSLARDLGEKAGSCGVLAGLKRTSIGKFSVNEAQKASEIDDIQKALVPVMNALYDLPPVILNQNMLEKVKNGMQVNHSLRQISGLCKMVHGNDVVAIGQIFGGVVKVKRGLW